MYRKNKIAYEYLDIRENQFYTSAQAWLEYRKNYNFIESFRVLNRKVDSKMLIANLFLDFYAIMNLEHHYYTLPIAFDKEKYIEKDLKEADTIAKLLLEPNKNFEKLQQIFHDTPKYRMLTSPLVVKEDYSQLIVAKNYKID